MKALTSTSRFSWQPLQLCSTHTQTIIVTGEKTFFLLVNLPQRRLACSVFSHRRRPSHRGSRGRARGRPLRCLPKAPFSQLSSCHCCWLCLAAYHLFPGASESPEGGGSLPLPNQYSDSAWAVFFPVWAGFLSAGASDLGVVGGPGWRYPAVTTAMVFWRFLKVGIDGFCSISTHMDAALDSRSMRPASRYYLLYEGIIIAYSLEWNRIWPRANPVGCANKYFWNFSIFFFQFYFCFSERINFSSSSLGNFKIKMPHAVFSQSAKLTDKKQSIKSKIILSLL